MNEALLLDTHTWIWLVNGSDKLGPQATIDLDAAAARQRMGVSEISFWEISTKASKGRLTVAGGPRVWLRNASKLPGLGIVQVDREVLVESALLEWAHHDPADRLLVATARRFGMRIASADDQLIEYCRGAGSTNVMDVRV